MIYEKIVNRRTIRRYQRRGVPKEILLSAYVNGEKVNYFNNN